MIRLWRLTTYLASLSIFTLVACSGSDSNLSNTSKTYATPVTTDYSIDLMVRGESTLLKNLAALYPNGQLPEDQKPSVTQSLKENPDVLLLTSNVVNETARAVFKPNANNIVASATNYKAIMRVQSTTLQGAYLFTILDAQRTASLSLNPSSREEGVAFWASISSGNELYPVHRFRNKINGTYLTTIFDTERQDIAANYSALFTYAGIAWYARQTPSPGWSPLYRFRNKTNGTYLFSAYEDEKNAIVLNYSAVFELEGIAYYVRQNNSSDEQQITHIVSQIEPPLVPYVMSISPTVVGLGVPIVFTVVGGNLPLNTQLHIADTICQPVSSNSINGFIQTCTIGGLPGVKNIMVMNDSNGETIDARYTLLVTLPTSKAPDSGISTSQCYGAGSNALTSCGSASATALNAAQDGMTGLDVTAPSAADGKLGFSYSRVANFEITECVQDNITGLMWEGKPSTGYRSGSLKYTNYDSQSMLQHFSGETFVAPPQTLINFATNSKGFIDEVNLNQLCGFSDWRLPTVQELESLLNAGLGYPMVAIDTDWFSNTLPTKYWTMTPDISLADYAWTVDFYYGNVGDHFRDGALPIRLVRTR